MTAAAATAVLAVLVSWSAGQPRENIEPPPWPDHMTVRYPDYATRARDVLDAWVPVGLKTNWRTGLVLLHPYLTWADGQPEPAGYATYPHWRYRLRGALPVGPAQGTVMFTDTFTSLRVPLISAAAAYRAIMGSPPPPVCLDAPDAPCQMFTLTSPQLSTVDAWTSRGLAIVPAWQFTVVGSAPGMSEPVQRIAVAPRAMAALARPLGPVRTPGFVRVWYAGPDPASPRRLIVGLQTPPCLTLPRVFAVQTAHAIVLAGVAVYQSPPGCAYQGGWHQLVVWLRAPPGGRLLLDAATGTPIIRHQPSAGA